MPHDRMHCLLVVNLYTHFDIGGFDSTFVAEIGKRISRCGKQRIRQQNFDEEGKYLGRNYEEIQLLKIQTESSGT